MLGDADTSPMYIPEDSAFSLETLSIAYQWGWNSMPSSSIRWNSDAHINKNLLVVKIFIFLVAKNELCVLRLLTKKSWTGNFSCLQCGVVVETINHLLLRLPPVVKRFGDSPFGCSITEEWRLLSGMCG